MATQKRDRRPLSSFWWPRPGRGSWLIQLRWDVVGGRAEVVDVQIRGAAPITTSLLRSIPWGRLIEEQRAKQRGLLQYTERALREEPDRWWPTEAKRRAARKDLDALQESFAPRSRGGRPPKYDAEHYAKVTDVYSEAFQRNRTPTRAVARHFGTSTTAAAKWVAKARSLGLLPPTRRGRSSGAISPTKSKKKKGGTRNGVR